MKPLRLSGRSSQDFQASLDPFNNSEVSAESLHNKRLAYAGSSSEQLDISRSTLGPENEYGDRKPLVQPSVVTQSFNPSHRLPSYTESIHRRVIWWSWHSAWGMYAFFLAGIGFAVGHHLYYASLHGQPATNQAERLRYGTLLAFLTKACLIWAVLGALRQRIWTTLQSKRFPLQGIDSLFAITDGPLAALDWRNMINAKIAISMATIAWLGPVMVILASQSISVEPTMDKAMCPGVKTLNFSLESVLDWRNNTKIDGLTSRSVSEWNTTRKGGEADFFDYWTFTSTFMKGIAWAAIYQKRAVYKPSASQEACGLDWNCRYTIRFTGPGYNCNITSAGVGSTSKGLRGNVPPFSTDSLLPRGNLSYIAYATGGEYAAEQMKDEDVYFGGIPKMDPPYPKSLGAFRVEPVLWVGYSSATRSGEEPYNRTQPGWDS
ncbi:hypothetical protein PG995_009251 [Apiospora arundinis]